MSSRSSRRGWSDLDDDTLGSVQPTKPNRTQEAIFDDGATKSAAGSEEKQKALFEAKEAEPVKPEDALLQPTLSSIAWGSMSPSSSKRKIFRPPPTDKDEIVDVSRVLQEKNVRNEAQDSDSPPTLMVDTRRATTPGAIPVTVVAGSEAVAPSAVSLELSSRVGSWLHLQTVSPIHEANNSDIEEASECTDVVDIERHARSPQRSVRFSRDANIVVAAEVAPQITDSNMLVERVRRSILEQTVSAEVVQKNDDDSKTRRNRWLYFGALLLFAVIMAIVIIVLIIVRRGDGKSASDPGVRDQVTGEESTMWPSQGPSSIGPTTSPVTIEEQTLIESLGVALNTEELSETTSPVYSAFRWVLEEDQYRPSDNSELTERFVLALLYYSTNGSTWINQHTFLSPADGHCSWGGVSGTIYCDGDSITEVILYENALKGTIPPEIQYLSDLAALHLWSNELSGTMPSEIGQLSALTSLNLADNQIRGTIPSSLFHLVDLTSLDLDRNLLSGTIPSNIGNCIRLSLLFLAGNSLRGSLPEAINELVLLEELNLGSNELLNGPLPSFSNNRNLRDLDLSYNSLSSTIPVAIFGNRKLSSLNLAFNSLVGTIPLEVTQMPELRYLILYNNVLTGTLPVFDNTPRLLAIDVETNQLTGDLNGILSGSTPNLEGAWLSDNLFSGSIPEAIGNNVFIVDLYLEDCGLSGSLPTTLALLQSMEVLRVGSNAITGTIPSELGLLSDNLKELSLTSCELNGTLPTTLARLTGLSSLGVFTNYLSGKVPSELGQLTRLVHLDVCCNNFIGALPDEWSTLSDLRYLYVEENSFTGTFPPPSWNATAFPDLITFWSYDNDFTGDLSPGFCNDIEPSDLEGSIEDLVTDCSGDAPEVGCTCCTSC